jgi:RNA polymerase sigma-B factor
LAFSHRYTKRSVSGRSATDKVVGAPSPHIPEQEAEQLLLQNLPLASAVARRYAGGEHVDQQFFEAALVGLVRAVDSCDPASSRRFEEYAEPFLVTELDSLLEDSKRQRVEHIRQRDEAAARAVSRIAQILSRQRDIEDLAMSVGKRPDDLALAMLASVLEHPELLGAGADEPGQTP